MFLLDDYYYPYCGPIENGLVILFGPAKTLYLPIVLRNWSTAVFARTRGLFWQLSRFLWLSMLSSCPNASVGHPDWLLTLYADRACWVPPKARGNDARWRGLKIAEDRWVEMLVGRGLVGLPALKHTWREGYLLQPSRRSADLVTHILRRVLISARPTSFGQGEQGSIILWVQNDNTRPVAITVGIVIGGSDVSVPGFGQIVDCEGNAAGIVLSSS
jgi:hypothetical protein